MAERFHIIVGIVEPGVLVAVIDRIALLGAGRLDDLTPIGVFNFLRRRLGGGFLRRLRRFAAGRSRRRGRLAGDDGGGRGGADVLIAEMLGDIGQRRAVVLRDIAVGADIVEQNADGLLGQVDAVALDHIAVPGVAGLGVLEDLGAVQKLPVMGLAHLHDGLVELVDLGLGQVFPGVLPPDGRDRVDDDIDAGVSLLHRLDARLILRNKALGGQRGGQVVGAEGDDHAARLHEGDRFRHCLVAGIAIKLDAGVIGQGAGRHADRGGGVIQRAEAEHAHARGVGIAQKQRFVDVRLPGVLAFHEDRRGILRGVDRVFVLVVVRVFDQRLRGGRFGLPFGHAVHRRQGGDGGQQHERKTDHEHKIHAAPGAQPGPEAGLFPFPAFCHGFSFPAVPGAGAALYLPAQSCAASVSINLYILHHFPRLRQCFPHFYIFCTKKPLAGHTGGRCPLYRASSAHSG